MGLITEDRAPEAARERSGAGGLGRSRLAGDDEQEITLGTRSLLGVFFGLVLVCGIFFGLGYSVGRSGGTHLASPDVPGSNAAANANLKKPSAEQSLTPVPEPGADTSPTPSGSSSAGSGDENAAGSSAAPAAAPVAAEPAAKAVAVPVAQPVARPAAAQAAPLAIARPAPPVQRPADLHQQPSVAAAAECACCCAFHVHGADCGGAFAAGCECAGGGSAEARVSRGRSQRAAGCAAACAAGSVWFAGGGE